MEMIPVALVPGMALVCGDCVLQAAALVIVEKKRRDDDDKALRSERSGHDAAGG
jgi:hypothetical protein